MPTYTLVIADEPFDRDDHGPAPFIETIEHGASAKCSTPATDAFRRCLDALREDEALSLLLSAQDARGALAAMYYTLVGFISDHHASHGKYDAEVFDVIDHLVSRAEGVVERLDADLGEVDACATPLPWHVAERTKRGEACVRAANGNSVFWAFSKDIATKIVAHINALGAKDVEDDGP